MEDKILNEKIRELITKVISFSEKSEKYFADIHVYCLANEISLTIYNKDSVTPVKRKYSKEININEIEECIRIIEKFDKNPIDEITMARIEELAKSDEYIASIKDRIKTAEITKAEILQLTLEGDEEGMVEIIELGNEQGTYKAEKIPQRGEK